MKNIFSFILIFSLTALADSDKDLERQQLNLTTIMFSLNSSEKMLKVALEIIEKVKVETSTKQSVCEAVTTSGDLFLESERLFLNVSWPLIKAQPLGIFVQPLEKIESRRMHIFANFVDGRIYLNLLIRSCGSSSADVLTQNSQSMLEFIDAIKINKILMDGLLSP